MMERDRPCVAHYLLCLLAESQATSPGLDVLIPAMNAVMRITVAGREQELNQWK